WMADRLAAEDDSVYAAMNEHDFFARFLIRVIRRTKNAYRCEAGRNNFGVGVDGGLYPCDSFIGMEEFRLGDVFSGVDSEMQAEFLRDTMVDEKPVCKDCWARYLCGGGCYYAAALANRDHLIPHSAKCDLTRRLIELSIWILTELRGRNPHALQRLVDSVFRSESPVVFPIPRESDSIPVSTVTDAH
ncbi:MAG: SPASM domain-containing protein, partial [Chloroflexi bacterium]|nr:SPASM domain-containing protein [Chloroflexota bacterium]